MNMLFNQHLWQSLPLHAQRIAEGNESLTPFQDEWEEYGDAVVVILEKFAVTHADILDEENLEDYFDEWCAETGCAESTVRILKDVLNLSVEEEFGEVNESNIRSLLKVLAQPLQSTETSVADIVDGRIPSLPNDAREFLRQLRVKKYNDAFGNDDAVSANNVKVFDRAKARYGHSPASSMVGAGKFLVLSNPVLNVHTENFAAIDGVGMDQPHQWIVVDVRNNQILTPYMLKSEALNLAASLNKQSEMLGEAALDKHLSQHPGKTSAPVRGFEETMTGGDRPLIENLNRPLNPAYLAYLENAPAAKTSTDTAVTMMSDWKATADLQRRAAKREDDTVTDADLKTSVRGKSSNDQGVELLVSQSLSDQEFLASINKSNLLQEGK